MDAAASPLPVHLTVINAMKACGLNLSDANILATKMFMDNFTTYKDILNKDIDDTLMTFSVLTTAQGQICLLPPSNQKIKAFTQWTK